MATANRSNRGVDCTAQLCAKVSIQLLDGKSPSKRHYYNSHNIRDAILCLHLKVRYATDIFSLNLSKSFCCSRTDTFEIETLYGLSLLYCSGARIVALETFKTSLINKTAYRSIITTLNRRVYLRPSPCCK